jgi:DNA-binding CsgD family transcriptional regulator
LTARERDCLALVGEGFRSKEIASRLGISPHTVDQHLKMAVRKIGTTSRQEAARWLRASQPPQSLGTQSPDIANAPTPSPDWLGTSSGAANVLLAVEEPTPSSFQIGAALDLRTREQIRGTRNDLTIRTTLMLIATLIAALLIGFGVLMTGIDALLSMRSRF